MKKIMSFVVSFTGICIKMNTNRLCATRISVFLNEVGNISISFTQGNDTDLDLSLHSTQN